MVGPFLATAEPGSEVAQLGLFPVISSEGPDPHCLSPPLNLETACYRVEPGGRSMARSNLRRSVVPDRLSSGRKLTCPHVSHTVRSIPELRTVTVDGWSHPVRATLTLLVNIWIASLGVQTDMVAHPRRAHHESRDSL